MKHVTNDPYEPHLFDKMPGEWWDDAACKGADPDLFFPPTTGVDNVRLSLEAKAICARCSVTKECLDFALTPPVERFGTWGGLGPRERQALLTNRRKTKGAKP